MKKAIRGSVALALAAVILPLTMASTCGPSKKNGGAGTPPPVPKYTWSAAPENEKNPPPTHAQLPPPTDPKDRCGAEEDPGPSGLEISMGMITGLVYSACEAPEVPTEFTLTLVILVLLPNGLYVPIKTQKYDEAPLFYPAQSPYSVSIDCVPGTYVFSMHVVGTGSDGKHFESGPTQGGDFYVHKEDC